MSATSAGAAPRSSSTNDPARESDDGRADRFERARLEVRRLDLRAAFDAVCLLLATVRPVEADLLRVEPGAVVALAAVEPHDMTGLVMVPLRVPGQPGHVVPVDRPEGLGPVVLVGLGDVTDTE